MRTVVLLLVALILSGCAAEPAPSESSPEEELPLSATGQREAGTLRFAAADANVTSTFSGEFANPNASCILFVGCEPEELSFDLTQQVPAESPVELSITVDTDSCVNLFLDIQDARIIRQTWQNRQLAALLSRQGSGTVALVVQNCSLTTRDLPEPSDVLVEARSVVRSSVLPAFLPALVRLAPGDVLEAIGPSASDITDLIAVPPGGNPVHGLNATRFEVLPDMPAGDYLVVVKGTDATLRGPNTTLRLAPIEFALGTEHAIPASTGVSWGATVPGLPLYAGLLLGTGRADRVDPNVSYMAEFTLAITQGDVTLGLYGETECVVPCRVNAPTGYSTTSTGTGLLPQGLGRGELTFTVESTMSSGSWAYEYVAYLPDA